MPNYQTVSGVPALNAVNTIDSVDPLIAKESSIKKGLSLAEKFPVDTWESIKMQADETKDPAFTSKVAQNMPWWMIGNSSPTQIEVQKASLESTSKIEAIEPKPVLAPPDPIPNAQQLDQALERSKSTFSSSNSATIKANKGMTFSDPMLQLEYILLTSRKKNMKTLEARAALAQSSSEKYQEMKKVLWEEIQKIDEKVQKDGEIAQYLDYGFMALGGVALVGTIIAFVFPPVGIVVAAVAGVGAAAVKGTETYFTIRKKEGEKEAVLRTYSKDLFDSTMKDHQDVLVKAAEAVLNQYVAMSKFYESKERILDIVKR